jgi:hypothetical protein
MIGWFGRTHPNRWSLLLITLGPGTRRVLVRRVDRGVDADVPGDQPSRIGTR